MRLPPLLLGAALVLGACSGSGNLATETAGNAVYNATYVGSGTAQAASGTQTTAILIPTQVTLTLSQLGSTFSGTMSSVAVVTNTASPSAAWTGNITGHVTSTGGTLTYVPVGCPGALYGSFTLQSDGSLSGSLQGRDCTATAPGDNLHVTFAGLVRQ